MKDEKKQVELLLRTSDSDDSFCPKGERGTPALLLEEPRDKTEKRDDVIDVVEAETVVVLPRVTERICVPAPEGLQ